MTSQRNMLALLAAAVFAAAAADARMTRVEPALESPRPKILERAGFEQKLGDRLPLDLAFRDEEGRTVKLGDYFGDRAVILNLVYYECPMLCNLVLNGVVQSLKELTLEPGRDFEVVTVSFDPEETHVLAAKKKANYLAELGRPEAGPAWHFLTGGEDAIRALTGAVGFKYELDEKTGEYAHGSGILVITPEGRVSHYLFGIEYPARDVRLALVEASSGRIGGVLDKIQLFCYQYNHALGRYSASVMALVQVGCAITIFALGAFLVVMFRREAAQRHVLREHAQRAGA